MGDAEALRVAAGQRGVVTRAQACAAGMSASAITRRLASGSWRQLHRGVLLTSDTDVDLLTAVGAARLAAGDGLSPAGVVGGTAAARLWGLDDGRDPCRVELLLPRSARRAQVPGVRLRWAQVDPAEVIPLAGVPCLGPLRVLADLTARLPFALALPVADTALRTGRCDVEDFRTLAGTRPRGGRRALNMASPLAESVFESRVRAELILARCPPPTLQHVLRRDGAFVARLDLAWPELRVAVEADGAEVHGTAAALKGDLRRQNAILREDWTLLRFSWADLGRIAPQVLAALRHAHR